MLTERTIINALIVTATFILAPFIIAETLTADFLPALIAGGVFALIIAFFFLKEKLSAAPLLGYSIAGSINFLPLPVGATQIGMVLLIIYYVTGYVLISQRALTMGKPAIFWPMVIVNGIVLYHVHTLSFGSMGGSTVGAKPAFLMYIYTLGYFCGINLPIPSAFFLSRIPLYAVYLTAFSSGPYLLSTYVPALAPYFYTITDNVNVEAYANSAGGTKDVDFSALTSKLAAFGPLASALQIYLLAHYPIGTWFSPRRLWIPLVSLFSLAMAVFSGFRSDLFDFFFLTLVGAWCYYSWRALLLPTILVVMTLVFLSAADNDIIHLPLRNLPMIAQRTMSFLPGDWDPVAIESGKGSNEFRQNIINVYMAEYAPRHPLVGNGFDIDAGELASLGEAYDRGGPDTFYLQAKLFIESKSFHTGWISVYDCVGLIGWAGFLWFQLALIFVIGRFIFGPKADRRSSLFPLYVWLQCGVTTGMASFYTVFGNFADSYTSGICYAIVIGQVCRLQKQNELASAPGSPKSGQVEFSGLSQTNYGNKYY